MFTDEELKKVDPKYFNIIVLDGLDVTIQSRNTGHWWYLHCTGCKGGNAVVVFHKWEYFHPYHRQCVARSLQQAVRKIKNHDDWHIAGRKQGFRCLCFQREWKNVERGDLHENKE